MRKRILSLKTKLGKAAKGEKNRTKGIKQIAGISRHKIYRAQRSTYPVLRQNKEKCSILPKLMAGMISGINVVLNNSWTNNTRIKLKGTV